MADDTRDESSRDPRSHTEEQLALSELRFRLFVSSVTDYAMFMLDPTGRVATWNPGAQLLKGYRADEIIGRDIETFYTPEDQRAGRPRLLLARALQQGRVQDQGYRVRKDGTRFWADVTITALRDELGVLQGYAKITRDLSERKVAEEALRLSEERFRVLIEQIEDYAIFMLDPRGYVTTWNWGAQRIKGYTADEIIGQHFSRFYEESEIREGKCERELEVAAAQGRFEDEGWRLRKDGTRLWANVIITALHNPAGELIGYAKVTRDLTERKNAVEERLRLARAQEAIRLRDEFLAIASHELKTPLTALQLQLQSLRERVGHVDAQLANKVERASRSSSRLNLLIESLLDVSRIATGRFTLNLEMVDLSEVVAQLIDALRGPAERAASEIVLHASGPLHGRFDRIRTEQVLTNLLSNALKYGAGKPVEVTLRCAGEHAVLSVRDHGPGIAEQDLSRIFGRFERAASMRHYGGLGLGLYVAQQIVTAHGGNILVQNEPDGGACFTVRLPLSLEHPLDVPARELH